MTLEKAFFLYPVKRKARKPIKFLEWTISRTLSKGQMCTDVTHLHNPVSQPFQQYLLVDKVLQLQTQLKWWSLFSLIRLHCFVLAGCSEIFHIYGHFCGIIFYFTGRLHFQTARTSSFLFFLLHYSQSRQWSEWTEKQDHFFWEETKELVARQAELKLASSLDIRSERQWFMSPRSNLGPHLRWTQQCHSATESHAGMCSTASPSSKHPNSATGLQMQDEDGGWQGQTWQFAGTGLHFILSTLGHAAWAFGTHRGLVIGRSLLNHSQKQYNIFMPKLWKQYFVHV